MATNGFTLLKSIACLVHGFKKHQLGTIRTNVYQFNSTKKKKNLEADVILPDVKKSLKNQKFD